MEEEYDGGRATGSGVQDINLPAGEPCKHSNEMVNSTSSTHVPAAAERKPPKNPWRETDESEDEEEDSGFWVAWRAVLLLLTRDDDDCCCCCCCCCWDCLRGWRTKALDRETEREARTRRRKAPAEGPLVRGRTMSVL